ncbi:MAG TPA: substrate-binding domain-containing protein [Anaeromyxobacteraceae bacterium]|nr:substrate-binding domain-containing protein [Anaeromyxobacteraceae bacterium]
MTKRITLIGLTAALVAGLAFSGMARAAGKKHRVFMNPKFTGLSYFEVCANGAKEAAKELGIDFTYTGSEQADVQLQVQSLENIVAQKPDAIVVSAIDLNAVAPPLVKAKQRGIKVVSYDADTAQNARDFFVNQMSYEGAARAMLDCALIDSPEGGEIAFIAASPTSPNHMAHIRIMTELTQKEAKYKAFKPVATQFAADDEAKSIEVATNLMQAHPNLKVIISSSAVSAPAAARAIQSVGKVGKVYATGVALPSSIRSYLKDGSQKAFFIWDPANLGYLSVYVAEAALNGAKPTPGTKIKAGKLGEFTVGKDGEVVYGRPLVFTKDNIDQFNF